MSLTSSNTRSHSPPFSHAEIRALCVIVTATIPLRSISLSTSSARRQSPCLDIPDISGVLPASLNARSAWSTSLLLITLDPLPSPARPSAQEARATCQPGAASASELPLTVLPRALAIPHHDFS